MYDTSHKLGSGTWSYQEIQVATIFKFALWPSLDMKSPSRMRRRFLRMQTLKEVISQNLIKKGTHSNQFQQKKALMHVCLIWKLVAYTRRFTRRLIHEALTSHITVNFRMMFLWWFSTCGSQNRLGMNGETRNRTKIISVTAARSSLILTAVLNFALWNAVAL
jgi:hypothetical protein